MINSELLKEAIADAKAVRATALANAKAALEEAFAPRFEAMFADKLKEESEEEEDLQEVEAPNQVSGKGGEAKGPATKAVSKGNPKKVSDAGTNWKVVRMGQGPNDVPSADNKIDETADDGSESEEWGVDENSAGLKKMSKGGNNKFKSMGNIKPTGKYAETVDELSTGGNDKFKSMGNNEPTGKYAENVDEAGLTSEDLDEIIKELETEVADEEEGQPVDMAAQVPETGEEETDVEPETDDEGEPATDPSAAFGGGEEGGEESGAVDINLGGDEPDGYEAPVGMNAGGLEDQPQMDGMPGMEPQMGQPGMEPQMGQLGMGPQMGQPQGIPGEDEDDDNINLEELLSALNEESEDEEGKEMDETTKTGYSTSDRSGQHKSGGVKGYPVAPQDASKKQLKGKNHNIGGPGGIAGHGAPAALGKPLSEITQYKMALKESYQTIEFLRGQINEVNLLNGKLLYTNKLFKEFADVLDNSYRMKIVESFDLTKNIREVKLAYALLAESLNFGKHMTKIPTKQVIRPAMKASVKQITEGFASKVVASTKPSQLITEGDEMALRFKMLAGIKAPKVITSAKK